MARDDKDRKMVHDSDYTLSKETCENLFKKKAMLGMFPEPVQQMIEAPPK